MSKELPKEMLPIYMRGCEKVVILKPLLQALFEQLFNCGIREFCFIVGKGKRAIEDHFTPDQDYVAKLNNKGKMSLASEMIDFYNMIKQSHILWVNQPEPRGFGHAVLMAKPFTGEDPFIVCAGDTYIRSDTNGFLNQMVHSHFNQHSEATILLYRVSNPKQYGVAITQKILGNRHHVLKVIEKPEIPPSNLAIMPIYIFNSTIMSALDNLQPSVGGEIQLTDALQKLIDQGNEIQAILLNNDENRLDIGTPETYWEAIRTSYEHCHQEKNHMELAVEEIKHA
jgi:UTP--glucose-1-phosphate uridylyltransferase